MLNQKPKAILRKWIIIESHERLYITPRHIDCDPKEKSKHKRTNIEWSTKPCVWIRNTNAQIVDEP